MGDAMVSALVNDVMGRLTSKVIKELAQLWGFKDDISTLKDDFDLIEAVLQDAEEKRSKEKAVELWLKRLRLASLEVEDVLDDISAEALLRDLHNKWGIKHQVRAFFSSSHNPCLFRVRTAQKVKAIRRRLDAIASMRSELSLTHGVIGHVDVSVASEMPNRETSSLIHDSLLIFGRNEEIEMITEKVCNKDVGKNGSAGAIRVYGIWGMGGVGKTTLAQLVYNHARVNQYFELKIWVYVSENFQVKEIMKKIIESLDKYGCTLTQLDTLQESLQNKLRGKKFLVILDDVWIEDSEKTKWDQLSETLSCGAEGSTVVITTRSHTTSRMMTRIPELEHHLGCLSQDDSWLLFKMFAFAKGREGDDASELEPIGREIVEKCKGLPLAIKTLGGLMWSKGSIRDWQHVKENNIWELQENKVLPALKLSYNNLLPHLKRCFAYCCLFPKGFDIEKDTVIQLWVVNGFIPPRGELDLFVLGEDIFNCLVWRSFFIVKVDKFSSDRYIMHDLMHDMAQHVMGDECLVMTRWAIEYEKNFIIQNEVLHLSSLYPFFWVWHKDLTKLSSLRSVFVFRRGSEDDIHQVISNHACLRVLYFVGSYLWTLPESIRKLKHLRYLNLSKSKIGALPKSIMYLQNLQVMVLSYCYSLYMLPETICNLRNLQVLLLTSCKRLRKLPEGLRYMGNLHHLDISSCDLLVHLPLGINELTKLRILTWFPVSNESGAKIWELGDLNLLEGELEISPLENVRGLSEAKGANLKHKRNLSFLELSWSLLRQGNMELMLANDEKILEGLEPSPYLKVLKISNYTGKIISPSWMVKLSNLVKIVISTCKNCEHIPSLGRLPNLRVIELRNMYSLKSFHDDNIDLVRDTTNKFLCVEELDIQKCPSLVSLPSNLPKLKVLRLIQCEKLASLPDEIQSFKYLNELDISRSEHLVKRCEKDTGIDWPKISHIPNLTTDSTRSYSLDTESTIVF